MLNVGDSPCKSQIKGTLLYLVFLQGSYSSNCSWCSGSKIILWLPFEEGADELAYVGMPRHCAPGAHRHGAMEQQQLGDGVWFLRGCAGGQLWTAALTWARTPGASLAGGLVVGADLEHRQEWVFWGEVLSAGSLFCSELAADLW